MKCKLNKTGPHWMSLQLFWVCRKLEKCRCCMWSLWLKTRINKAGGSSNTLAGNCASCDFKNKKIRQDDRPHHAFNSKQQQHIVFFLFISSCCVLLQATTEWPNCCTMNIWRKFDTIYGFLPVLKQPPAFKTSIIYHGHNALLQKKNPSHLTLTLLLLVHFPRALCSPKNILWSRENAVGKDRPRRPSALTAHSAVVIFMRTKFDEFPAYKCSGHIPDH